MIDKVITKILSQVDDLPTEILQRLQTVLSLELSNYEISPKSTEIVPYTGNPQILKMYLASKKVDGLSSKSILNYSQVLGNFLARLQKDPLDVTTNDIRMYLAIRESEGLKKSTIATLLSTLKSFYTWLENEEYILKSPCKKIRSIKTDKYVRKPLTHDELEKMRIACKSTRDKALLEFFYSTGCRLDEVAKLNKKDINWKEDSCIVMGKGSKEREVYLNAKARVHLQRYLAERKDDNEALFVCSKKPYARLGRRSIENIFAVLGIAAGLSRKVYPHLIRHTTATNALNAGASLTVVQKMLGHTNPGTTQIYAQLNNEEIKSEHRKHVA